MRLNYDLESQCFDSLVKFIFSRNYEQLQLYLNKIDQDLILAFPRMLHGDGGKSLIHICSRLKTYIIMEEIVEKFREMSIKKMIEEDKLTFKQANRTARNQIKEWVNLKTRCEMHYSAIHFACYHGQSDTLKLL